MSMNSKLKTKWIKALRSGKFKQTQFNLRGHRVDGGEGVGYCCLGVLAVCNNAHDRTFTKQETYGRKCGLTEQQVSTLTDMNDNGESFKTIATYIAKNI